MGYRLPRCLRLHRAHALLLKEIMMERIWDGTATETAAFVKNLLVNAREVVGFLESASGVTSVPSLDA